MDVIRSQFPGCVSWPPLSPPGGAQRKPDTTTSAGSPKRVRSISPMSKTTDGLDSLVLGSPVSPLISDTTPIFSKIRFLPLPPAAVTQASNPTGHDRPMENSPSPHHRDVEVTSAQHASNIMDEVEAEASDSPTEELLRALDRHAEALKEHTAALRELIATVRQTRNSTSNPRVVGR
ncbi:unnamed protein product [Aureobasidium pullulans]|nr:unnamed protein product [Aureobasidium pullulans]